MFNSQKHSRNGVISNGSNFCKKEVTVDSNKIVWFFLFFLFDKEPPFLYKIDSTRRAFPSLLFYLSFWFDEMANCTGLPFFLIGCIRQNCGQLLLPFVIRNLLVWVIIDFIMFLPLARTSEIASVIVLLLFVHYFC